MQKGLGMRLGSNICPRNPGQPAESAKTRDYTLSFIGLETPCHPITKYTFPFLQITAPGKKYRKQ